VSGWCGEEFSYNHDYHLMKHLSHFVEVGAKRVETTGLVTMPGVWNPDGTLVVCCCGMPLSEQFAKHEQFQDGTV
jgi:glucosylceramidase